MMKKTFITFFLFLIYMSMYSQKDTVYLELKSDTNLISLNFTCTEVIDATSSKGNLGYFKRGIGNKLVAVQFDEGFNKHLKKTITKLGNSNNKNQELVLIFRDFT